MKFYKKYLPYIIIFLLNFTWLMVHLPMPLVNETHFLVAKLGEIGPNNFNSYYSLLYTPIFFIINLIYSNYALISFTTIFLNIFSYCLIFYLFNKIVKDRLILIIGILLFSPHSNAFFIKIIQILFDEQISIFGFILPGPGYDLGYFFLSHRLFLLIFHIFSIYFYISNKNYLFFISLLLLNFSHANSGILISSAFIFCELITSISTKKFLSHRMFAILLSGAIPVLLKLRNVFLIKTDSSFLTNTQWYENMIKNEDDFSILFQIAYNHYSLAFAYLLLIFLLLLAYKKKINFPKVIYLFIFPFLLFLALGILEFLSVYFDNFTFIYPVIVLQPGYKLLSMSFLPLLLITSLVIKKFNFNILKYEIFIFNFLFLFLLSSSCFFLIKNNQKFFEEKNKILANYNHKISGAIDYLKASKIKHNPSFIPLNNIDKVNFTTNSYKNIKNTFDIKKIDESNYKHIYPDKSYEVYNKIDVLVDIIEAIKFFVPENQGIIVPPYQGYFRDALPEYKIFFQDKHDGNIMMGGKFISFEGIRRMKTLLKKDYTDLGSLHSGLFYQQIRKIYLTLKIDDLRNIVMEYPDFNYMLTESSHKIDNATIIFSNKLYNLYYFR